MPEKSRVYEKSAPGVYIRTFGCQMNRYDSAVMAQRLTDGGYRLTEIAEDADIIIFNTCSVRKHAEDRFFGTVNQLKPLKQKNPSLVIAVCGCTAQKEGGRILGKLPHVDIVLGTRHFTDILAAIGKHLASGEPVVDVSETGENGGAALSAPGGSVVSYVTAIRGCSNFCSYCVVPYLRGAERSRTVESIAAEVRLLADKGIKEVCLLGQNILVYGNDLSPGADLPMLLRTLDKIPGIERLRFLTSHPKDLSGRFIDCLANIGKVCECMHLPAQAGSDRILELMGRGYTRDYYMGLVDSLRKRNPGLAITTDIIAGFPSEKESDFNETRKLMEKVEFDDAFLYRYSPREGTSADRMGEQVGDEEKKARLSELIELQRGISDKKNRLFLNTEAEVLVEGKSRKSPGFLYGRTRTDKNVVFKGDRTLEGKLAMVRILKTGPATLAGEISGRE